MNKKDIFLIVGAVAIVLLAFLVTGGNKEDANKELIVLSDEEIGLIAMDYSTYESKIENGENFIVVIERDGCGYCEDYLPILEDATNELGIPVYDINIAKLTSDEYESLEKSNLYLKREKWGTPTTLLLSGDEVIDSIGGYVEKEEFVKFVKKNIDLSHDEKEDIK